MEKDNNINTERLSDRDVTAHTAAMWKYKPIPESPEPFPEWVCKAEKTVDFNITAASVRGKKHKHEGSNCDDSFALDFVDDAVIAAVADGAGSKIFSRIGAKAACEAVIKYVKKQLSIIIENAPNYHEALSKPLDSSEFGEICSQLAEMLRDSYSEAFAAVESAFEKRKDMPEFEKTAGRKPEIKDFSCTLLAAVIIPVDTITGKEYLTVTIQLGDGMIAAADENSPDNPLVLLGTADSGSFSGETEFITSDQFRSTESLMSRTKIRRSSLTSLLLMTDGVADDYYPNNPQLLRLILDLKLNGILDINKSEIPEDVQVPDPVSYPWVNDGDVVYALQYAKNVLTETNMSLEKLCSNSGVQKKASLENFGIVHERDKAEMLKIWLDNYVERGSFDDRTLVIINVNA